MVDELGKHVPMEPRRSYPVVIVTPERIAALEAEVARLREALAGLLLVTHDSYSATCGCDICHAVEVGHAALEPQKGAGDA